jgi:DNA-directed RNA polymerase subunit M/transcription elongation factor TFIIS
MKCDKCGGRLKIKRTFDEGRGKRLRYYQCKKCGYETTSIEYLAGYEPKLSHRYTNGTGIDRFIAHQ